MPYSVPQIPEEHKWSYEFRLDVLGAVLPEQLGVKPLRALFNSQTLIL